jgi:hypothetical protein
MKEASIEEVVETAKKLQEEGRKWHFHLLTPDCVFNKRKDKHAFVLENESTGETLIVYSYKTYKPQGRELAKLLYGKGIFDEPKGEAQSHPSGKSMQEILENARRLKREDRPWHHHVLPPNCIFNKHRGKWEIIFEDNEEGRSLSSVTSHEPKEDLKKIEILFYSQKK